MVIVHCCFSAIDLVPSWQLKSIVDLRLILVPINLVASPFIEKLD